ncbi:MAG: hypothetical protein FWE50_02395 [Alphaproteobacteria bacterium]|nr:hypothetical protein [Alphaproteobacteria bacterium]
MKQFLRTCSGLTVAAIIILCAVKFIGRKLEANRQEFEKIKQEHEYRFNNDPIYQQLYITMESYGPRSPMSKSLEMARWKEYKRQEASYNFSKYVERNYPTVH